MNPIDQALTQNVASIIMAGLFIWYLIKKDKGISEIVSEFNTTIKNHLKHSLKIEKDLTKTLQKLCDSIESLNNQDKK